MNFNALTLTLNNFVAAFSGGYGRLSGAANGLLMALGALDLVLLGLWWALGGGEQLGAVFKKLLYLGFWIWAVHSFPSLAKSFVDSLMAAGSMAGGGTSTNILLDPSAVAGHGLDATAVLAKKIEDLGTFDVADAVIFGLSYLLIMLCFLVMAINCFMAVLEYYLIVALVGLFLPFALFPSTKFLAEKALGAVVAVGMKLMTLAFVMAVVEPTLGSIHFAGDEIAMNELFAVLLTSAGCTFLSWQAPRLAAGLMSGAPNLGAGDVAQHATAAAGAAGMTIGALGGVAATRAASSATGDLWAASGAGALGASGSGSSGRSGGGWPPSSGSAAASAKPRAASAPRASDSLVKSATRAPAPPPFAPQPLTS